MSKLRPERLHNLLMVMQTKCRKARIITKQSNPRFCILSQYAVLAYMPQIDHIIWWKRITENCLNSLVMFFLLASWQILSTKQCSGMQRWRNLIKTNSLLILNAWNYSNHQALLSRMYTDNHKQCIKEVDSGETKLTTLIKKYWEQAKRHKSIIVRKCPSSVRSPKTYMLKVSPF